jgi:hypothetical protein
MSTKVYCGCKETPRNKKKGTMSECAKKSQIRLYGLNKIDPKLLIKDGKPKKPVLTLAKAFEASSALSGKITRLERTITQKTSESDKRTIKTEIDKLKKERKKYLTAIAKINKGEIVYKADVKKL